MEIPESIVIIQSKKRLGVRKESREGQVRGMEQKKTQREAGVSSGSEGKGNVGDSFIFCKHKDAAFLCGCCPLHFPLYIHNVTAGPSTAPLLTLALIRFFQVLPSTTLYILTWLSVQPESKSTFFSGNSLCLSQPLTRATGTRRRTPHVLETQHHCSPTKLSLQHATTSLEKHSTVSHLPSTSISAATLWWSDP